MSRIIRDRIKRQLDEAEGYLMLGLPRAGPGDPRTSGGLGDHAVRGELPDRRGPALAGALSRGAQAPGGRRGAPARPTSAWRSPWAGATSGPTGSPRRSTPWSGPAGTTPSEPLLHYNLACYWSLAGNAAKALDELAVALDLDPDLRNLIADESDFDQLRGNPEFERLVMGPAPLA